MPSICAIVLNYFGSHHTKACVDSLASAPLVTLRIVDNSSDPGESMALSAIVEQSAARVSSPRVVLQASPRNLGFSGGVNSAVQADSRDGGHDYYLLINNDARATPGMVERLLQRIESDPACLAVAPVASPGSADERGVFWYHRYLGLQCRSRQPLSFPVVSGCCLLVSQAALRDGMLLDERFFMYGEDVALCWRISRSGGRVLIDHDAHVLHEGSQSSRYGSLFYEYHVARGHVLLARTTWVSRLEVPLMLATKFLSLLARALVRAVRLRRVTPLAGFALAWLPMGASAVPPPGLASRGAPVR
ncbi:MAG: glycosyltransferase [Acidiferrobacteraceae bacterium]